MFERAVHELVGDDPKKIGALNKNGKKGGKNGKGECGQTGLGKGLGVTKPNVDRSCTREPDSGSAIKPAATKREVCRKTLFV